MAWFACCCQNISIRSVSRKHKTSFLEVFAHLQLRHPNIVSLYGLILRNHQPLKIVMEQLPGSLDEVMQAAAVGENLSLREMVDLSIDILSGMSFLHDQNIVHGSISLPNVLVSATMEAKIGDVGIEQLHQRAMVLSLSASSELTYQGSAQRSNDIKQLQVALKHLFTDGRGSSIDYTGSVQTIIEEMSTTEVKSTLRSMEKIRKERDYGCCSQRRVVKRVIEQNPTRVELLQ
eukprot:m.288641 g.288641  ORF g.288641 m.288641 type:complete len:233 (+) comp40706_c0_seq78:2328-3026(+)